MKEPSAPRLSDGFPPSWQRDDWAGLLVESYTAEAETLISVGVIFFFWIFQFWLNMSWAQRGSVKLWRPQSLHMTSLFHSYTCDFDVTMKKHRRQNLKLHKVYLWQAISSGGTLGFVARCRRRSWGKDSDLLVPLGIIRQPCGTQKSTRLRWKYAWDIVFTQFERVVWSASEMCRPNLSP